MCARVCVFAYYCVWTYKWYLINVCIKIHAPWGKFWGWLVGFYGISTFVGYLTQNPFLCKYSVLFQTICFNMSTQFNCQKHFYFKLFSLFKQFNFRQLSSAYVRSFDVKSVLFQGIKFSISSQFRSQKHFYFKLFS